MVGDGYATWVDCAAVDAAGYTGDIEVEIFNATWEADGDAVIATVARRHVQYVI